MNTESKITPKTLDEYFMRHLSAQKYDALSSITGISAHRLTKIKANPQCARYEELLELAAAMDKSPIGLIELYRAGFDNITLSQMDALNRDYEGIDQLAA